MTGSTIKFTLLLVTFFISANFMPLGINWTYRSEAVLILPIITISLCVSIAISILFFSKNHVAISSITMLVLVLSVAYIALLMTEYVTMIF